MGQAQSGDTVKVHYTGKLNDGTVFDGSTDRDPLQFKIGGGQVIPDFEQAVVGMRPGDSKTIDIESANAYGPYNDDLVLVVEREAIPPDLPLAVGQQLQIQQEDGQALPVLITDVSEATVTLDANHPLAGQDLTFDIELVAIV